MTPQEQADSVKKEFIRILRPCIFQTSRRDDGNVHLSFLRNDLIKGDRVRAENYVVKMFLKILSEQSDDKAEDVIIITAEISKSAPFRKMLCDVIVELIDEVYE